MNSLTTPIGLESPLRPTPTIPTSRATLEALQDLQRKSLPFQVYPTLDAESAHNDIVKAVWMKSKEAFALKDPRPSSATAANASRPICLESESTQDVPEKRHDSGVAPSPPTPAMPTVSRAQDSWPPLPAATTTTFLVYDRSSRRQLIAQALNSVRDRRPEAWRQGLDDLAKRRERVESLKKVFR